MCLERIVDEGKLFRHSEDDREGGTMAEWKQGKVGEEADCSEVIAAARWIAEETGEPVSLDQVTTILKESFKTIPRRDIELRVILCMDKMHRQGLALRLPPRSTEHDVLYKIIPGK
jgi:8-oxo-dGTP pyrophosphatase MutT (NUDIX family)